MSEPNTTQLGQFPDSILKTIISWTEKEDDGNLRLVSRKFNDIFDESIGVCWGKNIEWNNRDSEVEFKELPSCRKFFLSSVFAEKPVAIPIFRRKHLLQKMYLSSRMTNSSLNRILTGLTSLEVLKIYDWGITNLTIALYLKDVVNLKKLSLSIWDLYTGPKSLHYVINFLKYAAFPCLQELSVKILDPSCENMFCDALLKFLIQHKKSVSTLKVRLWNMTQGEDWPDLPDFYDRLNELESHKLTKVIFTNHYLENMTKLAEIFAKLATSGNMIKEADECRYFWNTDPQDYYLYCENQYAALKSIPRQMLQNNSSNLVIIGLNVLPEDCRPLDCSIFARCTSLKQLQLFTCLNSDAELTNVVVIMIFKTERLIEIYLTICIYKCIRLL